MWNFSSLWANMVKYDMCEAIVTDDDDVDRCGVSGLVNFFNLIILMACEQCLDWLNSNKPGLKWK